MRATKSTFSLLGSITLVGLATYLTFVGYIESDDALYARGALGWVTSFPFLGADHWSLRHMIIFPMAVFFRVFGPGELALLSTSIMYAFAFLSLVTLIVKRLAGWQASSLVLAIVGTTPAVATGATFVTTDLPEAFFLVLSLWSFYNGRQSKSKALMITSGVAAGFALITRETSVIIVVFYLMYLLFDNGSWFKGYCLVALGASLIVLSDTLYLFLMSGDVLYRLHTALRGVQGDGPQLETASELASGVDRFGALALPWGLRPFGAILLNQNFGLVFWAAIPAAVILCLKGQDHIRKMSGLFLCFATLWFVFCSYVLARWLWIIPRYYIVDIVLALPLSIWLVLAAKIRPAWTSVLAMILIGSNLALDFGSTTGALAGERGLVAAVERTSEIIHTDPATARGAEWLLDSIDIKDRVSIEPPIAGELFYYDGRPKRRIPETWALKQVPANWTILSKQQHPTKWTGQLIEALGIGNFLPLGLKSKLDPPPFVTILYRVPR